MQKAKTQVRYMNPGFSVDWPIIIFCLTLGPMGIWVASSSDLWRHLIEQDDSAVAVGKLKPIVGRIRLKKGNSSAWQDLSGIFPVSEGDSISTGESGTAYLNLVDETQVKLLPNSLVVVHLEQNKKKKRAWWSSISESVQDPPNKRSFLEIKQGTLQVHSSANSAPLKLLADGKKIQLDNQKQPSSLQLSIDPDHPNTPLVITPKGGSEVKLSVEGQKGSSTLAGGIQWAVSPKDVGHLAPQPTSMPVATPKPLAPPFIPEIIGPLPDSVFASNADDREEVKLKWKTIPNHLLPEVELKRAEDTEFKPIAQMSQSGASFSLPDGNYEWKVRTISSEGKKSEWSSPRKFSIRESIKDVVPVTLQESIRAEKEKLARQAAKEAEIARLRQIEENKRLAEQERAERESAIRRQKRQALVQDESDKQKVSIYKDYLQKKYQAVVNAAQSRIHELEEGANFIRITSTDIVEEAVPEGADRKLATTTQTASGLDQLTIRLQWKPIPTVSEYQIKIFKNDSKINDEKVKNPRYDLVLKELDPQNRYGYQVSTALADGRVISSEITPINITVTAPIPVEPAAEATLPVNSPVQFTWAKTFLTVKYDFQVARDMDFKTIVHQATLEENVAILNLPTTGTYYWRLRGIGRKNTSEWSKSGRFFIR